MAIKDYNKIGCYSFRFKVQVPLNFSLINAVRISDINRVLTKVEVFLPASPFNS